MTGLLESILGRSAKPRPGTVGVYCFGQSNAVCLAQAWRRRLYRPADPAFDFKFLLYGPRQFPGDTITASAPDGTDTIHAGLAKAFEDYGVLSGATEAWIVSVVRGSTYNVVGLFEPDPLFDFVEPGESKAPLREGAQVLPYDAVRATFERGAEQTERFYKCLPRHNVAGVIHLEAPPPIPSEKQCKRSLEGILLHKKIGVPKTARISPPGFRMKLWRCQCDVHREMCRRLGLIHVTAPQDTLDAEGFLRPEAWWGATHANAWYGARALREIESVIALHRRNK